MQGIMINPDFFTGSDLIALMKWRAENTPDRTALIIEEETFKYGWLWENIEAYASQLMEEGIKDKDPIVVMVPNSTRFFIAFYGSILAGAIVVPIFPTAGTERCSQIMNLCGSGDLILPDNIPEARKDDFIKWASENNKTIHWLSDAIANTDVIFDFPDIKADDIAFIQYTSGSTGFPKGVPLTHSSLLTNVKQMTEAMAITGKDVFVSWLPVYHDMGLILMTMVPFYTGAKLVLLQEGMHRIHSWLKAIEEYRGTFIAAPDIAYRICVKGIRRPEDYDLSSLRVALNASEPIHRETYQLFEDTFKLKNVMASGYGLAEATVAVTMHPPGTPPRVDDDNYVASGKPVRGVKIRIDKKGIEENPKNAGEILVKSPALMKGYFNRDRSPDPFDSEGYLRTGDIGYLDSGGYLYVLSRKKNIILHAGHTLYPDDVEQVILPLEDIRQVAAVGIDNPKTGGEMLHVFVELRKQKPPPEEDCHNLIIEIVQRINDHFGVRPARVILLKPKTIPHTPNGKMQYHRLREMYLKESNEFKKRIVFR